MNHIYLGEISQLCCINAASANQRLFTMLKSLAMLEVGMWGEPCGVCGCCKPGSFRPLIAESVLPLMVRTLHSYGENLYYWREIKKLKNPRGKCFIISQTQREGTKGVQHLKEYLYVFGVSRILRNHILCNVWIIYSNYAYQYILSMISKKTTVGIN